jgi:hypothetical protein
VVPQPPEGPRGVVRLLNTAAGRVLCLAGVVDGATVASFLDRYGAEPVRIDAIDALSVTVLSAPACDLVRDHLEAAARAGRHVTLRGRLPPENAQAAAQAADGYV